MNEKLEYCARLKHEYYIKNIKMLYNWSKSVDRCPSELLVALGMFEHVEAIEWLLNNKSTLNAAIDTNINQLPNSSRGTLKYNTILDRLKVALVVCNKTQAIKILSSIVLYSNNPKEDIENIETF